MLFITVGIRIPLIRSVRFISSCLFPSEDKSASVSCLMSELSAVRKIKSNSNGCGWSKSPVRTRCSAFIESVFHRTDYSFLSSHVKDVYSEDE